LIKTSINTGVLGCGSIRPQPGVLITKDIYNKYSDFDAKAFLYASGSTGNTNREAIYYLCREMKMLGVFDKMTAVYPFIGTTATSQMYNLRNAQDTNAAFRLSFVGGWTHSVNGAQPNGTNAYANTFINSQTTLTNTSTHISVYSRTLAVNNQVEIGCYDGSSVFTQLRAAVNAAFGSTSAVLNFTTTTDARGFWLATKRANNDREAYLNGVSQATVTTNDTTAFPNLNMFIGARNDNGTANVFSNKQLAFVTIGSGLTDAEVSTLNTIVQIFQTTLGRQV